MATRNLTTVFIPTWPGLPNNGVTLRCGFSKRCIPGENKPALFLYDVTGSYRTNADTPEQVASAIAFGAQGIGLTRTEHMFFEGSRIDAMREMILAESLEERRAALAKLLPYQREDFVGIG